VSATTVFVKPGRLRAQVRRHPWIYGDSIDRVEGPYVNGDAVVVRAPDGRFVAHAFINDQSRLFLRLVSFDKAEPADEALVRRRVQDAVRLRHDVLRLPARADAYRVIHSEGDGLPGLVVDRYGPVLTLTCTSLGTYRRLDAIVDELERALSPVAIIEHPVSDGLRGAEGLPEARGVIRGALPAEDPIVTVDGLKLRAPLQDGQKTALYLDQRENVRKVAALCEGRRVLDACTYVGTFAIAAARAGATQVDAFDQSDDAVAMVGENAARNGVADRVRAVRGRLYDELRGRADRGERWDVVVLDPPKFAASQKDLHKARKGYFDANLMAMKLVAPGGILVTFSCSHHMEDFVLEEILREAATRADQDLRVLDRLSAGQDHPVDVHCPEGRYLKGFILQRRIEVAPG
jgi:23S rRNA (cytosine1962-C5)-methyltransferase